LSLSSKSEPESELYPSSSSRMSYPCLECGPRDHARRIAFAVAPTFDVTRSMLSVGERCNGGEGALIADILLLALLMLVLSGVPKRVRQIVRGGRRRRCPGRAVLGRTRSGTPRIFCLAICVQTSAHARACQHPLVVNYNLECSLLLSLLPNINDITTEH
jgi:hypothetical protein